jgi:hypothetical protein
VVNGRRYRAFAPQPPDLGTAEEKRWMTLGTDTSLMGATLDVKDAEDLISFLAGLQHFSREPVVRMGRFPPLEFDLFNGAEAWMDKTHSWGRWVEKKGLAELAVEKEHFYASALEGTMKRLLVEGSYIPPTNLENQRAVRPAKVHLYVDRNRDNAFFPIPFHDPNLPKYLMSPEDEKDFTFPLEVTEAGVIRDDKGNYGSPVETDKLPAWEFLFEGMHNYANKHRFSLRRVYLHGVVDPRAKELTFDVSDDKVLRLWFDERFWREEVLSRKGLAYHHHWVHDKRWRELVKSASEKG